MIFRCSKCGGDLDAGMRCVRCGHVEPGFSGSVTYDGPDDTARPIAKYHTAETDLF